MRGSRGSRGQTEFTAAVRDWKEPQRNRWSRFPKAAPDAGPAGGRVPLVPAVYLCAVIWGSCFRPQRHPTPTSFPSFPKPDGGGADRRGNVGGWKRTEDISHTSRVSGSLGEKLCRKDCFAPCVCIAAVNKLFTLLG